MFLPNVEHVESNSIPLCSVVRCGDEDAAGPLTELGTASDIAGESWPE